MPFFKTQTGINLHYEIYPRSSAKQLTFIHGHLGSTRWWTPVLTELKKKQILNQSSDLKESIVLIDFHGCGESDSPKNIKNFKFETVIQDINDLLISLNLPEYNLIGHSAGGLIVLHLLAQLHAKYKTGIMISPVGLQGLKFDSSLYPIYDKMVQSFEITKKVIGSTIYKNDDKSDFFNQVIAIDAYKGIQKLNSIFVDLLKNYSSKHITSNICQKNLIIHGQNDHLLPLSDSEELNQILAQSTLAVIENAGHCPIIETPITVAEYIHKFYFSV